MKNNIVSAAMAVVVSVVMVGVFCFSGVFNGKMGPRGFQGEQGVAGIQGSSGPRGPAGVVGPMGRPGDTGPAGLDGAVGARGLKGDTGPKGESYVEGIDRGYLDSVYRIFVNGQAEGSFAGSAVAVDEHTLYTCAHMLGGRDEFKDRVEVEIRGLAYGGKMLVRADVVKYEVESDLMILKVDSKLPSFTKPAYDVNYQVGDALLVVGNPGRIGVVASFGWVGDIAINDNVVLSSNGVFGGNSGGGVYHIKSGKLIGILSATVVNRSGAMAPNVSLWVSLKDNKAFFGVK